MTPRAFFRQRNEILRPLARFVDPGTGLFFPTSEFFSTPQSISPPSTDPLSCEAHNNKLYLTYKNITVQIHLDEEKV